MERVIEFNNMLKNYVDDYTLLCIYQTNDSNTQSHEFTTVDNIDFLDLKTRSLSNGLHYVLDTDTNYVKDILRARYTFDLISLHVDETSFQ